MITLNADAKEYWQKLLENDPSSKYVRLGIKGSGCAGFSYTWDYTSTFDDGVLVDDILVVEDYASGFLKGSEVKLKVELMGTTIEVSNPNELSSCGCGESRQFTEAT